MQIKPVRYLCRTTLTIGRARRDCEHEIPTVDGIRALKTGTPEGPLLDLLQSPNVTPDANQWENRVTLKSATSQFQAQVRLARAGAEREPARDRHNVRPCARGNDREICASGGCHHIRGSTGRRQHHGRSPAAPRASHPDHKGHLSGLCTGTVLPGLFDG